MGVVLDKRLNYKTHIDKTLTSANATLRQLYAMMNRKSGLDMTNKLTIYKTILRPIVTYAAPVWCRISVAQMTRLERFQNKCLRLITGQDSCFSQNR
mgnify:FL=1